MNKNHIRIAVQVFFVVLCMIFVIRYFRGHLDEFQQALTIPVGQQLLIILFLLINNVFASLKLLYILKNLGLTRISFNNWFTIFLQSRFINFHLTQGANAYRSAKLKQDYQFPVTKSIGMIVYFTWFETVATLSIALILLIILGYAQNLVIGTLGILLGVVLAGPFLFLHLFTYLPSTHGVLQRGRDKIYELATQILGQIKDPQLSVYFAFLTFWMFLLYSLIVYITFQSLEFQVSAPQAIIFTIVLLLSRVINLTPANIGLTEIICGYLTQSLGSTLGAGILVSGVIRVLEYLLLGILVILIYGKNRLKPSSS